MLAAHRAHVNGLDSAYSAIVLDLHSRKITQGIRHRKCIQVLQFCSFKRLRDNNILGQGTRRYLNLVNTEVVVYGVYLCLAGSESRVCTECENQYEKNLFIHCSSYSRRTLNRAKCKRSGLDHQVITVAGQSGILTRVLLRSLLIFLQGLLLNLYLIF